MHHVLSPQLSPARPRGRAASPQLQRGGLPCQVLRQGQGEGLLGRRPGLRPGAEGTVEGLGWSTYSERSGRRIPVSTALESPSSPGPAEARLDPYVGPEPFRREDAWRFFGRREQAE